ncbi:DUF1702 family protein [Streptomyces sp. NPDC091292]|uniref:DUF1702 family protein n=1 Tax=Streptomyces sp. NPDC091292 TaxID=3365991 RepID=UPI0037FD864D
MTPPLSSTSLEVRGFKKKNLQAQELLETIGRTFLEGYGHAVQARSPFDAEARLEEIPEQFRGFAYEGAAMGCAMLDAIPGSGGRRLAQLLDGRGRAHVYMVNVGIGWAMARLPKALRPKTDGTDPLLRWLVLDGYGFHQAYFRTDRYVHQQYQEARFSWSHGPTSSVHHAIDQGIGRALWFVGGTDVDEVVALIDKFAEARRADLYSGAGLAATYAGGADEAELEHLRERAGAHRPHLLQGSAFAAEARERAGLSVAHTHTATKVLCRMDTQEASLLCRELRPVSSDRVDASSYEEWRQRIAETFIS